MKRPETKARMSAANLNGPPDLDALGVWINKGIAEREFAARVQTNQHRLRSELKPQGNN